MNWRASGQAERSKRLMAMVVPELKRVRGRRH